MVSLDLTTKSSSADLDSCHDRPVPTYSFALMPTQMLLETRDPLLLLSDTVSTHADSELLIMSTHVPSAFHCTAPDQLLVCNCPSKSVLAAGFLAQRAAFVHKRVISTGPSCLCWNSCKDHGASNHSPYRYNQNPTTGAASLRMLLLAPALHFFRHCVSALVFRLQHHSDWAHGTLRTASLTWLLMFALTVVSLMLLSMVNSKTDAGDSASTQAAEVAAEDQGQPFRSLCSQSQGGTHQQLACQGKPSAL